MKNGRRHHHPDTAKEKPQEGEVVAVGTGARNEQGKSPARSQVRRQDPVRQWSGTEVRVNGEDPPHHEGIRHPRDRRLRIDAAVPRQQAGVQNFLT
jgi:hypothetical protein